LLKFYTTLVNFDGGAILAAVRFSGSAAAHHRDVPDTDRFASTFSTAGNWDDVDPIAIRSTEVRNFMARLMSSTELAQRLEDDPNGVVLIDVLDEDTFTHEHIPGAINIPLDKLPAEATQFKKNQRIVVYGETHSDESSNKAAELLERMGFRKVSDFDGGKYAWKQAGYLTNEN